ncbi:MAG: nitroreductase family protein [Euryarchaeota archaeon]|nr:nitroreductase family protein [Euryarchaeota archaeon]MDE1835833.1 nitroreductase family protein [Euryarchaeota archaeon]MDE1880516.1 nitroreductase family protein [Euryarchaeota archaeon]MDE2045807.1 nitroreductase family protein [Thermoplasmata archaeon]
MSDSTVLPEAPFRTPLELREAPSGRVVDSAVDPLFVDRWSPRSFLPGPVPRELLATLFEAARWAPSSNNEQPWLYVYATDAWDRARFLEALAPGNRAWAEHAPALVFLFARRTTTDGRPYRTYAFDAGASWMSLALQARLLGLDTHPMGGFDPEKAYAATGVDPARYEAMIAIALGYRGPADALPVPLAGRERPSGRVPQATIAQEGCVAFTRAD